MSTKRTYVCNLCLVTSNPEALIGFEFETCAGTSVRQLQVANTENHICKSCLKAMRNLAASIEPSLPSPR